MGWMAAAGGAEGLANYYFNDKPNYQRQTDIAAATQRYSPFTGQWANAPSSAPSAIGDVMQGATTGAKMGASMGAYQNSQALSQAQSAFLNSQAQGGGSPGPVNASQYSLGNFNYGPPANPWQSRG